MLLNGFNDVIIMSLKMIRIFPREAKDDGFLDPLLIHIGQKRLFADKFGLGGLIKELKARFIMKVKTPVTPYKRGEYMGVKIDNHYITFSMAFSKTPGRKPTYISTILPSRLIINMVGTPIC